MTSDSDIGDFDSLLEAAKTQLEPQRLLFVFAEKKLDPHHTEAQREAFERGEGGHLEPKLLVDKLPEEVASFEALVAESEHTGQHWDIMFVSSMEGRGGIPPSSDEADQPLRFMITAINEGNVSDLAAFDREGTPLNFHNMAIRPAS